MYILIDKNTSKVIKVSEKGFVSYSDNLLLVEVESLPEKYDYLTAKNIKEVTKTWTEIQDDYDDNGEILSKEIEKSKTYTTCDLTAVFNESTPISEDVINRQKEIVRSNKIVSLIRKKYSLDDELAILRQKDSKIEKYEEYYNYVESCIKSVPKSN